ncbi:hypothetical protein Lal_00033972, partial [Lupinus albus]
YFVTMSTPSISSSSSTSKRKDGGGNKSWTCNFCNKSFKSSYSRVNAHLLRIHKGGIGVCSKVNDEYLAKLQLVVDLAENKIKPKHVPLPTEKDSSSLKIRNMGPLEKSFNTEDKDHLAANHNLSGFLPLGYNALRTTLLQQEKTNVERLLKPIKSTWKSKGVSIVSDGWTDSQRMPLINFMATSEGSPIFLNFVDASEDIKSKYYIIDRMAEVIKEVGEENVVQVITNNVVACKSAGMIIEASFPKVFWTPCVVHTLNLALNICDPQKTERNELVYEECCWITQVVDQVGYVKNYIMSHTKRLVMFNHFSSLKLLAVVETRFASIIVMLRKFKFLKRSLQSMIVSEEWDSYREGDIEHTTKAQTVKEHILNICYGTKLHTF